MRADSHPVTSQAEPARDTRAQALAELLPYIHACRGRLFVVDYACASILDQASWNSLGRHLTLLHLIGLRLIVVHRSSTLNTKLVALLNRHGARAVGLSGVDDGLLQLRPTSLALSHNAGMEAGAIRRSLLDKHLDAGLLPVIRPVAATQDGMACPMDGSQMAAVLASHLQADKLILLESPPTLIDRGGRQQHRLSASDAASLTGIPQHIVDALATGVRAVHFLDARHPETLLVELLTPFIGGALLLPDAAADVLSQSAHYLAPATEGDENERQSR